MFSFAQFTHEYEPFAFRHVEPVSEDFRVFVNGTEVPVYTCRISRYPFNRVWTGFQRPIDQTERASFVSLVSDEELTLEVIAHRPHERVLIKPYSEHVSHTEKDGKITFTLRENGYFVLETDDYHHCLYIFNSAPIAPPKKEEVTHYFGAGVHFPGKITLHSNESVYVDKDALVFGCIFAENAENIRIFGNGLLDDTGEERVNLHCYEPYTNGNLKFYDCRNVRVEGVLLRNSATWCLSFFHCFQSTVDQVKIFGQWRYNTDGVDIVNCGQITVKNSFIHSFDDAVTIKGIDRYAHTDNEDIVTENCVLWCDWGKTLEVGTETACRRYRNIVFRHCDILRAGNTALDIQNGDCAEISDVLFEHINVEYNAFDTKEVYQKTDDMPYGAEDTIAVPHLIHFANHRFRNAGTAALWGIPLTLTADLDLHDIKEAKIHDVVCRHIRVYYDEGIPKVDGKYNVPIRVASSLDHVRHENILVSDVTVNGEMLTEENAILDLRGAKSFRLEAGDAFSALKENTVSAEKQLRENEYVTFEAPENTGLRVLFLGNSITRHGAKAELGWHHDHGMAASAKEKDYVHLLMARIRERDENAAFCICQGAEWERNYKNGSDTHHLFAPARDFGADLIIMRLVENCPMREADIDLFQKELLAFFSYLDPAGKAKIVLTTGFWRHPLDEAIRALAAEKGYPLAELSDLGDDPAMKALGLFAHAGVANHPGDRGMEHIAKRIFQNMF